MLNFLTNIDWSSMIAICSLTGIVVFMAVACYLIWAWSENKGPFKR